MVFSSGIPDHQKVEISRKWLVASGWIEVLHLVGVFKMARMGFCDDPRAQIWRKSGKKPAKSHL